MTQMNMNLLGTLVLLALTHVNSFTLNYKGFQRCSEKFGGLKAVSRRDLLVSTVVGTATTFLTTNKPAIATESQSLDDSLYLILRVKEATEQESRLIRSGKFKDVQRANIKLAIKFMLDNYRLSDNFNNASAFLPSDKKIKAYEVGQAAVQNLYTILEYFDSSDVQNLKVDNLGGKQEGIVLNGLNAARGRIDEFLKFFDSETLQKQQQTIKQENQLNVAEFDASLGNLVNMPTSVDQQ